MLKEEYLPIFQLESDVPKLRSHGLEWRTLPTTERTWKRDSTLLDSIDYSLHENKVNLAEIKKLSLTLKKHWSEIERLREEALWNVETRCPKCGMNFNLELSVKSLKVKGIEKGELYKFRCYRCDIVYQHLDKGREEEETW